MTIDIQPKPQAKLENFTSAIAADAMAESMRIYNEIEAESNNVMSAAENEYLEEMYRYIKKEVSDIRGRAGRAISRRMLDGKYKLYTRRSEMSDAVMDIVTKKVSDYVKTPEYLTQLKTLLKKVLSELNDASDVYLREADMPFAEELSKIKMPFAVTFKQGSFELGGLIAACPSRKMQIDETFDATLSELRGHFAELFGLQTEV